MLKYDIPHTEWYVFNDIELQGNFFQAYWERFSDLLMYFGIDEEKDGICSRLDYRIDVPDIEVKKVYMEVKKYDKKLRTQDTEWETSWFMRKTDGIEWVCYNKRLDILEKREKANFVDIKWRKPFQKYIDYQWLITRIEYRKLARSMRKWENNSIKYSILKWRNDMLSYCARLGIYFKTKRDDIQKIVKQDIQYDRTKERIIDFSETMLVAYAERLKEYDNIWKVSEVLLSVFGNEFSERIRDLQIQKEFIDTDTFLKSQ